MPVRISDIPGTLAGYDIVLSVSEEAVNAQLEKLYRTKITRGPLPPPTKVSRYMPLPQAEHLINHKFSLHEKLDDGSPAPHGIDGYIACPKLRFRPPPQYSGDMGYRNAFVELTFIKDETQPEGKQDSKLKFWNMGKSMPVLQEEVINGYTISWQVNVGKKPLTQLSETLEKTSDGNSSTTIPDRASNQLQKYVDPQNFTVASIFCTFEEASIVNSFSMRDPSGELVTSQSQKKGFMAQMMKDFSLFFVTMQAEQKITGAPTPDNPYVLGYAIAQTLPEIKDIDGNVIESNTPAYFKPREGRQTVTAGEQSAGNPICTSGTLNFCMLTHREGQTAYDAVDTLDLNAGLIPRTFFDTTKTLGKVVFEGREQGHDGIMAFSKQIFSDHWVKPIGASFLVNYGMYLPMLSRAIKEGEGGIRLTSNGIQVSEVTDANNRGWRTSRSWAMDDIIRDGDLLEGKPYGRKKSAWGDCVVQVTYSSDLPQISSIQDGINHARRVRINIDIKNELHFNHHTRGVHNLFQSGGSSTEWLIGRTMDCRVQSLVVVEITPGAAGKWNIMIDRNASQNLIKEGEELQWQDSANNNQTYGNFDHFENHHTYKGIGTYSGAMAFRESVQGWKTDTTNTVARAISGAFADAGTTVIMPAGQVFTYAGLDTDPAGHLYCQVNYANDTGFEVRKQKQQQ